MTTPDIPEIEPVNFRAGTTVKWKKDLSDSYPADESWTLTYTFINSAGKFTVSATADGKRFSVTISAATSAAYTAGVYQWIARVSKSGETFEVDSGHCEVLKDLAAVALTTFDQRSHAKKVLDAIEAVIEGRASQDQMAYQINGRQLSRTPIPDLLVLRDRYRSEYGSEQAAENINNALGSGRKIKTRFL